MVATTASSTIVKPASSRRRAGSGRDLIGRTPPPWRTSPSRRASRPARRPSWRAPGRCRAASPRRWPGFPRDPRSREGRERWRCPRSGPWSARCPPRAPAVTETAAATDGIEAHARACRPGSPPARSPRRWIVCCWPTASVRYDGSKSRRIGVPSSTATRADARRRCPLAVRGRERVLALRDLLLRRRVRRAGRAASAAGRCRSERCRARG